MLAFAVAVVSLFPVSGARLAQAAPRVHHTTQNARAPQHQASTYSCVAPHCYGQIWWNFVPSDTNAGGYGGFEQQEIPWLWCGDPNCQQSQRKDLLTNEMWLVDNSPFGQSQCSDYGNCWIEVGIRTYNTDQWYFWADEWPVLVILV